MKLGIIRCMQTEDYCPGSRDFRTIRERKGAFMGEDDIQLVGFINCGGCPGKKAVLRARSLVEQGADTIAFASCISKGTPIGYPCPFAKRMRELVQKEVGDGVRILDYTHDAGRIPDAADPARCQILRPAENIDNSRFVAVCHRIDREITPSQVLTQFGSKYDFLRVTSILIFTVNPVGGYFISDMITHDRDRTVLKPGVDRVTEHLLHLLRVRRGRDIPVTGNPPQDRIADTAADCKCLVTMFSQLSQDFLDLNRHFYPFWNHINMPYPSKPSSLPACRSIRRCQPDVPD